MMKAAEKNEKVIALMRNFILGSAHGQKI